MNYLIMSCSTGGGHNSAAHAIEKELVKRGHEVTFLDPYDLVNERRGDQVGWAYIKLVQTMPKVFGSLYFAGEMVSRIPIMSPVYFANAGVAYRMKGFLKKNNFDGIIMSHIYPAEMITMLKRHKVDVPPTFFVATDYICIPFTAETDCDYYCVPGEDSIEAFTSRGIPREKIKPCGIPVHEDFDKRGVNNRAIEEIGLSPKMRHILAVGGSVGAGQMKLVTDVLGGYIKIFNDKVDKGIIKSRKLHGIVVCGNNEKLYKKLHSMNKEFITVLKATDNMPLYMKASDIIISKPGGLSSTEAAVAKVPLIHISPIPGCESFNVKYFDAKGMSVYVKNIRKDLASAITALLKPENRDKMLKSQKSTINDNARNEWCDFIEEETEFPQ